MKHARPDYNGRIVDLERKIPEYEPVMLLRGQDIIAPKVLRFYAAHAAGAGCSDEVVLSVLQQARVMEEWQRTVARKVADFPAPLADGIDPEIGF